jgi:hypothetical protein
MALGGGRAGTEAGGGRTRDELARGRPVDGAGGRATEPDGGSGRARPDADAAGRTGTGLGGLVFGREGTGLIDVGVGTGGREGGLGLMASPGGTIGLDVVVSVEPRPDDEVDPEAVLEVAACLFRAEYIGWFALSLLESFVKSTISRASPVSLSFDLSTFPALASLVSSDKSTTSLALVL